MKHFFNWFLIISLMLAQSVAAADYRYTFPKNGLTGAAGPAIPLPPGAPMISSLSPTEGLTAGGEAVVILGENFQSGATVSFGGLAATLTELNATSASVLAPAHAAGTVTVTLINPDNGAATASYTYTNPYPSVFALSPATISTAGATVAVQGSGFLDGVMVTVDGIAAAATRLSSTELSVEAPAHTAATVPVVVTNPDNQSVVGSLTYANPPVITSLSYTKSPLEGGQTITLSGAHFLPGAEVLFGDVSAASVTYNASTSLTAVTPAHAAGLVDVTVINPNGVLGALPNALTYADWTLAFTSNRGTDWQVGTSAGTSANNPHASQGYSEVWEYLRLSGNGLNLSDPWWRAEGEKQVWDDEWFGASGQWVRADDVSPNISSTALVHNLYTTVVNFAPAVDWHNPFNETIRVTIRGPLSVHWTGKNDAWDAPVDLAVAKSTAEGNRTLLFNMTAVKPNADNSMEFAEVANLYIADVLLQPGESIRLTQRTQTSGAGDHYNRLFDGQLFIDVYRLP